MRSPEVQEFLDQSAASMREARMPSPAALAACNKAIGLWQGTAGRLVPASPLRLPVCDWVAPALELANEGPRAALAAAFAGIAHQLQWTRRSSARPEDTAFWDGHANAVILGPGGLEERSDLMIGATVMAPHTTYGDHNHPPEEVYLSLTPGEWWNAEMDWTDPGAKGAIYNPPAIRHQMRSGAAPFLALWYLPS
ncbi:dimethylsulfonioproprionate lyase family protein [Xinfangfangia sp. CPCC 101601]|uniref:Dimethylsulfonioproprionate lyase family protein n=1 Tax=Pseudogemmobacter lacusdianii TaxID=3069608 RepID=A0ABU0VUC7_9RHOB|nr:dimethylsulfonioproprionate lyase family protein [Xinfangfangia sp. CPCC 101601]MDQ2065329.1 dimethylsulfonioproprionate lyase family protein [Xinfangfangia sp. CPCC 101601]